jgi:hypothetical protein
MSNAFGQACAAALRMVLVVPVIAALCVCPRQSARAQEGDRQLLVTHVSPALTAMHQTAVSPPQPAGGPGTMTLSESASSQITGRQGALTQGERWEKFETEFGVDQKNSSFVKGRLASAKYRLDRTAFELQEWVENVEGALKFDYSMPNPTGSSPSSDTARASDPLPFWGSIDNPHLKSDVDLDPFTRRAFVGVKVVIKFGN